MAEWSPLRRRLAQAGDRLLIGWSELDEIVGGLPRSAYEYPAFWKGDRPGWPGFTTDDVQVGVSVTFVRRGDAATPRVSPRGPGPSPRPHDGSAPDLVLVGCVKQKLDRAAPACDLYTSPLFRRARTYAEATGAPWFILSAEHGLVEPSQVIEPYELRLTSMRRAERRAWGRRVVDDLARTCGSLAGKTIEVHAGAAYADAIREPLRDRGASVDEPLSGLTIGRRLAWYGEPSRADGPVGRRVDPSEVEHVIKALSDRADAVTPRELLARGGVGLQKPGLYSWWVDAQGAADLEKGLGEPMDEGLIYAGLAGATRTKSGRRSKNTLWGRLEGMHLGGRHQFSTFRLSLGSILAEASGSGEIDEARLTQWMYDHLRVIAVPVEDADVLDGLETAVLAKLDPPLNLQKMAKTAIRTRLKELRRQFNRKARSRSSKVEVT